MPQKKIPARAIIPHRNQGKIEAMLRRSSSLGAVSGLAKVKISSPGIKKKFKATVILTPHKASRIDGLSPFGSPYFTLVHIRNSLMAIFPSSRVVYMDYIQGEGIFSLLGFPDTGYSLWELASASILNRRTRGEVTLMEVGGEHGYLLSIDSEKDISSCQMELMPSLLLREADFSAEVGVPFSVTYSDYRPVNGARFPFKSVFRMPGKGITVEFSFRKVRPFAGPIEKRFRVPLPAKYIPVSREELTRELNWVK